MPVLVPSRVVEILRGTKAGELAKSGLDYFQSLRPIYVDIPTHNGDSHEIELQVPEGSFPWMEIKRIGVYEPALTYNLYNRLLTTDSDVFFDIGAHFGYFTQIALEAGIRSQRVFAFEANKIRFRQLAQVHEDDGVNIFQKYVGDGEAPNTIDIDTIAEEYLPPTIVKIDVEGSESQVLRGMSETLKNHKPLLYVELHPQTLPDFDGSVEAIFNMLEELDYALYVTDHREGHRWEDADLDSVPTYDPSGKHYNNPENTYLLKAIYE